MSVDTGAYVVVTGSIVDKAGENRLFPVLMTKDGMVVPNRSSVRPKKLTT